MALLYDEIEYQKDYNELGKLIDDNKISKRFKLSSEMTSNLIDRCILAKQYSQHYEKPVLYYICCFILGSIYIWLSSLFRPLGSKAKFDCKLTVFIQTPSIYNKFGKLATCFNNSLFCYVPVLSRANIRELINEHRKESISSFVPKMSIWELCCMLGFVFKNIYFFFKLGAQKKLYEQYSFGHFLVVFLLKYYYVKLLLKGFADKTGSHNTSIILDYDKTEIVFALKDLREKKGYNYKLITINHGAFAGFDISYIKSYSDLVLCTCAREVELSQKYIGRSHTIYKDYGIQLLAHNEQFSTPSYSYDGGLLILGTETTGLWLDKQLELLLYLKRNGIPFKYRLRPGSANTDKINLSPVLMEEDCTKNTTLMEDCSHCDRIISFSLDALGTAVRLSKRVAIYITPDMYHNFCPIGEKSDEIIITSDFREIVSFLSKSCLGVGCYNEITQTWIHNNIGELSFIETVNNIKTSISSLL